MTTPHPPNWYESGLPHIWQPYTQAHIAPPPLPVSHTEGCEIVLSDGRRLIDGISSWWCTPHGHGHPHLVEAAKLQLETIPHVMFAGLAHEPAYRLATRLATLAPDHGILDASERLSRVFFSDSGSTAVEVALKIALQYRSNRGEHEKIGIACLEQGYHGDTFGAMSVSDPKRGMHNPYTALMVEQTALPVPFDDSALARFEAELTRIAPTTTALIIEPLIQGAGGMRFYSPDMLAAIHRLCRQHDILLIADEIMTGFGRTGTLFACEQAGITPDILCIGKGLSGGMITLAATLASERLYDAFLGERLEMALMHGPTYMANPLACTVANASLDLFEQEPRLQQVARIEQRLTDALSPLTAEPHIQEVRVRGAVGVVQFTQGILDPFAIRPRFVEMGCWLRPFKDVIYVMPPFTISDDELTQLTDAITRVCRETQ